MPRAAHVTVLIAAFLLLLDAAFVGLRLSAPSDGTRIRPELATSPEGAGLIVYRAQVGGLRSGDIVVAVGGVPVDPGSQRVGILSGGPAFDMQAGQTVTYTVLRDGTRMDLPVAIGRYDVAGMLAANWNLLLILLTFWAVATYVFIRRPEQAATRALLFATTCFLVSGTAWAVGIEIRDLAGDPAFWIFRIPFRGVTLLAWAALLHFALLFPKPHPVLLRRPWLVRAVYGALFVLYPASGFLLHAALGLGDWLNVRFRGVYAVAFLYMGLALAAAAQNYRSVRDDPVARLQMRWILAAAAVSSIPVLALGYLPEVLFGQTLVPWDALMLLFLLVPFAFVVAILRYHLFDLDVLVNRTLVYGSLTAMLVVLYAVAVGYAGSLLHDSGEARSRQEFLVSLLGAGLVAVLFQPLRERIQRTINRLMYGERDDPYVVLSRLGQRLEVAIAPQETLAAITETVAQALKLPYVAIALSDQDNWRVVAAYGREPGPRQLGEAGQGEGNRSASRLPSRPGLAAEAEQEAGTLVLPLVYQRETIGRLVVAPRSPGEAFTAPDRRLLADIARETGAAAHAVRLTADLQRSRERLVTAREEERRRLRRDLHDGLGPALAGLTLKLDAARNLLAYNPAAVDALLLDLKAQTQSAVADIRRLVYDLRPPALDDLGLLPALREHAVQVSQSGLCVSVEAPDEMPALPAAVEVAAYRVALEALTNVIRHAQASNCLIRFRAEDGLSLEVVDDGQGLPAERRAGVGLNSMRERVAELGGTLQIGPAPGSGTRLVATWPLEK